METSSQCGDVASWTDHDVEHLVARRQIWYHKCSARMSCAQGSICEGVLIKGNSYHLHSLW